MPPLILLTNDDGIDAAGIQALESALPETWECHVVAPTSVMSQCGHRVTTDEPLRVHARGENRHAVEGTPADCVRLALTHLLPRQPDWVLSGINEGGNLGADIYVSGTVAAVREGAFLGVPGIALSHFKKRGFDFDWAWAARCAWEALEERPVLAAYVGGDRNGTFSYLRPKIASICEASDACETHVPHDGPRTCGVRCVPGLRRTMMRATFCLQPGGDSPYRKSVFDAALAGCIPVVFSQQLARVALVRPELGELAPPFGAALRPSASTIGRKCPSALLIPTMTVLK